MRSILKKTVNVNTKMVQMLEFSDFKAAIIT